MKKPKKLIERLSEWEWKTLVSAWRYYQYGHTIASSTFPEDIIRRFWLSGKYAKSALDQIATQFVRTDHRDGEEDWTRWEHSWDCDNRVWCKFYAFCKAWLDGYTTLTLDNGKGNREESEAFYCEYTKQWHPKDKYISEPHLNYWCPQEYIKEVKNGR